MNMKTHHGTEGVNREVVTKNSHHINKEVDDDDDDDDVVVVVAVVVVVVVVLVVVVVEVVLHSSASPAGKFPKLSPETSLEAEFSEVSSLGDFKISPDLLVSPEVLGCSLGLSSSPCVSLGDGGGLVSFPWVVGGWVEEVEEVEEVEG
ncbi:hypothetical protein E2C01_028387 [Portunus trituberculatus]|uniref:Uncharacterized protein n=1 Tax=Portunus trituberculatus TaxID=210409 RepID=A0A5B7EKB6_PORTR|nr:hypothetical protein [Portunus trituberculatus]